MFYLIQFVWSKILLNNFKTDFLKSKFWNVSLIPTCAVAGLKAIQTKVLVIKALSRKLSMKLIREITKAKLQCQHFLFSRKLAPQDSGIQTIAIFRLNAFFKNRVKKLRPFQTVVRWILEKLNMQCSIFFQGLHIQKRSFKSERVLLTSATFGLRGAGSDLLEGVLKLKFNAFVMSQSIG